MTTFWVWRFGYWGFFFFSSHSGIREGKEQLVSSVPNLRSVLSDGSATLTAHCKSNFITSFLTQKVLSPLRLSSEVLMRVFVCVCLIGDQNSLFSACWSFSFIINREVGSFCSVRLYELNRFPLKWDFLLLGKNKNLAASSSATNLPKHNDKFFNESGHFGTQLDSTHREYTISQSIQ